MTVTWSPGDPVYARERERYVCADPGCGAQWSVDVLICPRCEGPAKDDPAGDPIQMDTRVDNDADENQP